MAKECNILRILIQLGVILAWSHPASADQMISAGQVGSFVVHNLARGSQKSLLFELTVGYGTQTDRLHPSECRNSKEPRALARAELSVRAGIRSRSDRRAGRHGDEH